MIQQDSSGNLYHHRMIHASYIDEPKPPIHRMRSIEVNPNVLLKTLDFTTGNGKGHIHNWNMALMKFEPVSCNRPTCKVCGIDTMALRKGKDPAIRAGVLDAIAEVKAGFEAMLT